MGCDIHAYIEIKINDKWHYYASSKLDRNYDAFCLMANVREDAGSLAPISLPRGLPNDVSFMTKKHAGWWGEDGHSHSWLTYLEMKFLIQYTEQYTSRGSGWSKYASFNVYVFGNDIMNWHVYPDEFPSFLQDIRIVFWFDN